MIATASARHASQIIGLRISDRQRVTPSIYRLKPLRHFNGLYVILHSGDMAAIVALRWLVAGLPESFCHRAAGRPRTGSVRTLPMADGGVPVGPLEAVGNIPEEVIGAGSYRSFTWQ
jgi:hypothetical protein